MFSKKIKKVVVGMSGGVDSSVSAWLLLKQGYQVEGLFMKNWEEDDNSKYCSSFKDLEDAKMVCKTLNIPLHTINFSSEYWENVFQIFLKDLKRGYTPNPDILCNKEIKFKSFLDFSIKDLKADFIATGHYVKRIEINQETCLMCGSDQNKDQSYFLYTLSSKRLKKCLFPIGELTKIQVRKIAKKLNLITANKKDSVGICFIGKKNFQKFIKNYLPKQKQGPIINTNGKIIGTHQGIIFYTLGQRKGLNIGGIKNGNGKPWWVVNKDLINNTLIVSQEKKHPNFMSIGFIAEQTYWINRKPLVTSLYCDVKIRYRKKNVKCQIRPFNNKNHTIEVFFKSPTELVTPGQAAVFYLQERCLGGGTITKSYTSFSYKNNNLFY